MELVNPRPLQMTRAYELEEDGVEEEVGQKRNLGEMLEWRSSTSRTSELTIAFEGEVYVFPAVSPQKVQAVLLLLGGSDAPTSVPSSEFLLQQNSQSISDMSQGSKLSRRFASLVRFREKRKERCFEKKIRYTCRKEVAQRMHRKNGQFASLKDCETTDVEKWEPSNGSALPDTVPRSCQHCGTSEKATPAMRRGPAGPRTLCNACGLMWANKGTLRDLTKGGRHSFDQNEPGTPDVKPSAIGRENSYVNQGEEGSPEDNKPLPLGSENYVKPNEQEFLEADENLANPIPMHVENSSITLDEEEEFQGTLDELGIVSVSEFEIPGNFDDQVDVGDSHWRQFGDDAPSP